ncbi:MAG: hypothetical protein JST28_21470 [Acidobacteria bacterium]|nr:hypothetical protein [Acidobacteriota bacterium]
MPVPQAKSLILVFLLTGVLSQAQDAGLVQRALANEVRAADDTQHPMRYHLRKSSPRLTTTKEIFETADGAVARLISVNDAPLSSADEQREQARLDQLLSDPGKQRHRKQSQDQDTARALKVLRSLPNAFLYEDIGEAQGSGGKVEKYTYKPNPNFDPPDLETQVLTQMAGELWIDRNEARVTRLEGRLQDDVDFGWGILGRLYKGGSILLVQADVGDHQWRLVHFDMKMSARVVFKTKVFDTTEDESQFVAVPAGLRYQKAIAMLRDGRPSGTHNKSGLATK